MPITITFPPPAQGIGPGQRILLSSSFIGPQPDGTTWRVYISSDVEHQSTFTTTQVRWTSNPQVWFPQMTDQSTLYGAVQPVAGTQVYVTPELVAPNFAVIDSGTPVQVPYEPTAGLGTQIQNKVADSSGFTPSDRQLLNDVAAAVSVPLKIGGVAQNLPLSAIFTNNFLDSLTTASLSNGITCDPVSVDISLSFFQGVQLEVAEYPVDWQFRTPDGAWGFHDLAVLSFVRGGVLLKRLGIHTTMFTEYPLPGTPFPWIIAVTGIPTVPNDYVIRVDWADGVCGELRGLLLP